MGTQSHNGLAMRAPALFAARSRSRIGIPLAPPLYWCLMNERKFYICKVYVMYSGIYCEVMLTIKLLQTHTYSIPTITRVYFCGNNIILLSKYQVYNSTAFLEAGAAIPDPHNVHLKLPWNCVSPFSQSIIFRRTTACLFFYLYLIFIEVMIDAGKDKPQIHEFNNHWFSTHTHHIFLFCGIEIIETMHFFLYSSTIVKSSSFRREHLQIKSQEIPAGDSIVLLIGTMYIVHPRLRNLKLSQDI